MSLIRIMFLFALSLSALVLASPAQAQGWTSYHNARFGAAADIPPAFSPSGPEATNSDGLIFRTSNGSLLTIYGASIPGGNFEQFVLNAIAHDESYNGWPVQGQTITPDWAEYWGSRRGQTLKVRMEATCSGKIAVVAKFEVIGGLPRDADRVFNSLTGEGANAC